MLVKRSKLLSGNNLLFAGIFLLLFLLGARGIFAVEPIVVSATIPDHEPPSTPILISPPDGALLSTGTPTFEWYESTDNVGVAFYQIWLDGQQVWNNVPTDSTETSNYQLIYDALNGIYSLTPKQILTDGEHTWQIRVFDASGNNAHSDIWQFSVDTLVPFFTIQKIGDVATQISSLDPNSVPSQPILLFQNDPLANEPIIQAIGEASSSVHLQVTIPSDPTQTFDVPIDANGNWQLQLGILPRDVDIRLDFTITDLVGHVSVIENLLIRLSTQYWPPSNTPTPTPTGSSTPTPTPTHSVTPTPTSAIVSGSPTPTLPSQTLTPGPIATPTPGEGPITIVPSFTPPPTPTATVTPTPTKVPGTIEIPIIPPKEIVHEVTQETSERLPQKVSQALEQISRSPLWLRFAQTGAFSILVFFPLLAFLLLLSKFWSILSFKLIKEISQLLFQVMTQQRSRKNLVFEYSQTQVAPLVKVELRSAQDDRIVDYTLTDHRGNFADFAWNDQTIKLRIVDKNFYFPVGVKKPVQLDMYSFYQDEIFIGTKSQPPLLIPTLLPQGHVQLPLLEKIRQTSVYLLSYPWWFFFLLFIPSLMIALRYYSWWNGLAILGYILLAVSKLWHERGKIWLRFDVRSQQGQRLENNLIVSSFATQAANSQAQVISVKMAVSNRVNYRSGNYLVTVFAKDRIQIEEDIQLHAVSAQQVLYPKKTGQQGSKRHPVKISLTTSYIENRKNSLSLLQPVCQLMAKDNNANPD